MMVQHKLLPDPCRPPRLTLHLCLLCCLLLSSGCSVSGAGLDSEEEREGQHIVQALELGPGMRVADVGAGDGEWTRILASAVGDEGQVYSTEVDTDDLEDLRRMVEDYGLGNVRTVEGNATETGLPTDCCDAILLRRVYHHFTDPEAMRRSLREAMRPEALLAVVEITTQKHWSRLEGVPERDGHGIESDVLIAEMSGDGFEVVATFEEWPGHEDHYCVVFRLSSSSVSR